MPDDDDSRVNSILKGAGITLYFTAKSEGPNFEGSWLFDSSDFNTFTPHQLSDQISSNPYAAVVDGTNVFVSGNSILWEWDGTNVSDYTNTSFKYGIGIEKAGDYLYILSGENEEYASKLVQVLKIDLENSDSELKFPNTFVGVGITYSNGKIYVTGFSFGQNPTLQEALKVFSPIKYQ